MVVGVHMVIIRSPIEKEEEEEDITSRGWGCPFAHP